MGPSVHDSSLSVEEYLEGELCADLRHEYVNGVIYAMVGVSKAHNTIALNLAVALRGRLRGGHCQFFLSDVKVHVKVRNEERFYYPDVIVDCDSDDPQAYFSESPLLIVEVLSEHTERNDRSNKFYADRRIESLSEYIRVAQDEACVEIYRRDTGWDLEVYRLNDVMGLKSVGVTLGVSEVYADVVQDSDSEG